MADSTSPQKPMAMQPQSQSNPDQIATPVSNPNPNIASPAIASPSLSDLSQQSQLDASVAPDYALKQPNLMAASSGFQMSQQQLQRSNSVQRLSPMQQLQQNQQFGAGGMSPQAMRMYAAGSGQMNFGNQQQQLMSRAGIMGQVGLPLLPGQTAPHYALQNPILSQQRQKGMVQNAQFNTGNVGQALSGMQSMGVMGQMNTLGMNQIRTSGALSYAQQQRYTQMRAQQQIPSQSSLPSPQKLSGQGLGRTASLAGMTPQQQQQFLKQMTPQQQQLFLNQLSQQKQHQLQQFHLQQFQQQQQQNSAGSSPRVVVGPTLNRSVSLTSSQQESNTGNVGNNGSVESGNQVLGKRKIRDLVSQVDPMASVGDAVEDLMLEIADDFLDSVTAFACSIAKHRKSNTVEPKDVLLHLEKNWNLTMPGYSRDEKKQRTAVSAGEAHKRRMEMVKAMVQSQQVEQQQGMRGGVHVQMPLMANNNNNNINNNMNNMSNNNNMNKPVVMSHNEMGNDHPIVRTASNPESQFSLPSVAMMQKVPRF